MSAEETKQQKPWYRSRIVLINALAAGVAVADQITPIIPPAYAAHAATIVFIANTVLRLITTQPIARRG